MLLQAVLLMREGLRFFDPGSDLLLDDQGPALFLTWRKQGKFKPRPSLPQGAPISVIGVFLRDDFGNITYVGEIGREDIRYYIQSVIPRVRTGYQHSKYHKLFAPPGDVKELLAKLETINRLYYESKLVPEFVCEGVKEPAWEIDAQLGITRLCWPVGKYHFQTEIMFLKHRYDEIVHSLWPYRSQWGIVRPVYKKVG